MRQLTHLTCDLHRQLTHADKQRPAERLLAPRQAWQPPAMVGPAMPDVPEPVSSSSENHDHG